MKIDNHPNKSQIDALLAAGVSLKEIVQQVPDLNLSALRRYRKSLQALAPPDDPSLEGQLALWTGRADALYIASAATLDLRGQAAAVGAGFRALEFALRNQKTVQEQAAKDLPLPLDGEFSPEDSARFVAFCDSVIENTVRREGLGPGARWLGMQTAIEKRSDSKHVLDLFQRLLDDPALLTAVQQMTAEPQPETRPSMIVAGITPGAN
jgi:hypothetical protein